MVRIEVIPNRSVLDIEDYFYMSYTSSHGKLFKDFCEKKEVPIRLPYIGDWYWAKEIAKLGHISFHTDENLVIYVSDYIRDGLGTGIFIISS